MILKSIIFVLLIQFTEVYSYLFFVATKSFSHGSPKAIGGLEKSGSHYGVWGQIFQPSETRCLTLGRSLQLSRNFAIWFCKNNLIYGLVCVTASPTGQL